MEANVKETNEEIPNVSYADLVRYISTGEASPTLEAWLSLHHAEPKLFGDAEPDDQSDGAGAHWR